MARRVQVQPAIAERARLQAVAVGHRHDHDAARRQQARRVADRLARLGQVLERVPEHDRRPLAVDRLDRLVAEVRAGRGALEAGARGGRGGRARRSACRHRRRRPAPARAGRSRPAARPGSRACGAAARRRGRRTAGPSPGGTTRRRRRSAPPREGQGSVVAAPHAAQRIRPRCRTALGPSGAPHQTHARVTALLGDEQTAKRSSAASRPSSRRWKSSGAIAAARGSSACR